MHIIDEREKRNIRTKSETDGRSWPIREATYTGRVDEAAGRDGVDMRCVQECPLLKFERHAMLPIVTVKGDSKSRNLIFGIKSS